MAEIRPFCAVRPRADWAEKIAALPYDVYNRKEAREETAKHPESFLCIDRAETQFPEDTDPYAPEVYQKAHDLLYDWIAEGRFEKEKKPCYYVYEETREGRTQTGIVACASVDDYENNVIKKHEETRAEKEEDRIRHVDACNAQTGPIFLAYRKNETICELVARAKEKTPVYDFISREGIGQRVFLIDDDKEIAQLKEAFAEVPAVYIADGHHRAASAVKVSERKRKANPDYSGEEEFNYFLSVLFPDEELFIMDYNRIVKDLNGMTREEFLSRMKEHFRVSPCTKEERRPKEKGMFGMYLGGQWYQCRIHEKDKSSDPVENLDVFILQEKVLAPLFGITEPKTDARISFAGGIRGLDYLEEKVDGGWAVAFAMHPTSITELFAVADAGKLMPPKSTWFEPKLYSGLFLHELN